MVEKVAEQAASRRRSPSKGDRKRLARVGFACIPVCSVFRRIRSRRGGGGVGGGGDPCTARGGTTRPGWGNPSTPPPPHPPPAPTRTRPLPMGFLPNTYPCG